MGKLEGNDGCTTITSQVAATHRETRVINTVFVMNYPAKPTALCTHPHCSGLLVVMHVSLCAFGKLNSSKSFLLHPGTVSHCWPT